MFLKFPKNFLWGVSTSAYQIEGGADCDWSRWERSDARSKELEASKKNRSDFVSGLACDSYNRYEEDLDLVKNLHCGAYRIGLEWSRLEPREGEYDQKQIEHYRRELQAIKDRGIKSVVTLWHWTSPGWLADRGGWRNPAAAEYFSRYAEKVVRELGGLVDYWLTINEPMVYLSNSYLQGKWPPQQKSFFAASRVFKNLVRAHRTGYRLIHQARPEARVGLTMLANYFEPAEKWNPIEVLFARLANYFWNDRFIKKLKGDYDFLGLDYYFHDRVIWRPPFKKNLNRETSDLGWEIYPAGIYEVIKNFAKFNKPLIIMENGLADESDSRRGKFIIEHLKYVHQALSDGFDVRGYFHWSLLDNFEWSEGFGPKFGLYAVDRRTFTRAPRPSAKLYGEICKNNLIEVE